GYFELYQVPFKYLPYFDYLEKRDYFVPGGILQTDTIFDWCVEKKIPYYCSNWRHSEERILLENKRVISEAEIKLAYVYLPKLDGIMHNHGPFSEATRAKLQELEQQITGLYRFATKLYDDVALYVISDHGMAPVTGSVDLISIVESLGLVYARDYVAFYDSTMARFWWLNPSAREVVLNRLSEEKSGMIVRQEDLAPLRVRFEHNRFGDDYFVMQEGILINPSYMGLNVIPGMHGFHPDAPHSYSVMLSNREIPEDIQSITDIRKTMEYELEQRT
ncbi:MAG TPA: alkaline phosphatase family protein, partial [Candidatus Cloacimonadota bacterium]|nr:alkaline phosphatase family protein [Candidatus Cloacimonadota bacterium]